ncbi:LTA synthase family protein [Paenibacillus sp. MSJ-34]|nr:LTA synthase family protein [Paenibacillus sp. MSJ-34]MBU5444920.1 LTA synthase family protein [Paenibacillus sp. MSJ-34]
MAILFLLKMMLLRYFFYQEIVWTRLAADAAALLALLSLVELVTPLRRKAAVYWPLNAVYSLILFAATLYFEHFNSVPTYTALYALRQVGQITSSVLETIQPSNVLFFADLIIVVLVWIFCKVRHSRLPASKSVNKIGVLIALVAGLALSVRFIQAGMPIQNELTAAEKEGFLNYQISSAIKSAKDNSIAVTGNTDEIADEINRLQSSYSYSAEKGEAPAYFGAAKGKNVIVLQLESFQNFPINLLVEGKELTPVLNKLAAEGFYFPHVFQQIGNGNTSDAEFMSNTSIYPTGKIAMSTGYGDRKLPSLPRLLQERNYATSTFHVNDVTFWDRDKLYPAIGFDHYYDKPFYNDDKFNNFGASDEELYRAGVEKLAETSKQGKPFYAQFITASSHHPFLVPEDRRKIALPDAMNDTQLGDYLYAVNYTDYAIGTLIDRLKENGLWDNTVLVMYGDHYGLPAEHNDPQTIRDLLGIHYDSQLSRFNIPLIIHMPGCAEGKTVETVGGQVDMMPTLANLLGISLPDEPFTAFGHDLLNIDKNVVGMRYYLPTGSFFNNDVLFVPGTGFEDGEAISIKTQERVADLTPYRADYEYILKLMELSDRYVGSLPKR